MTPLSLTPNERPGEHAFPYDATWLYLSRFQLFDDGAVCTVIGGMLFFASAEHYFALYTPPSTVL
jgi:hypothetical protein